MSWRQRSKFIPKGNNEIQVSNLFSAVDVIEPQIRSSKSTGSRGTTNSVVPQSWPNIQIKTRIVICRDTGIWIPRTSWNTITNPQRGYLCRFSLSKLGNTVWNDYCVHYYSWWHIPICIFVGTFVWPMHSIINIKPHPISIAQKEIFNINLRTLLLRGIGEENTQRCFRKVCFVP